MKILKKIGFYMFICSAGFSLYQPLNVNGQFENGFFYGSEFEGNNLNENDKTDIAQIIKNDSINTENTTLLYKIRQYFGLTGSETYDQKTPATGYVKMILNMILGLTSFISLILIIYAFYLMFFQKQEEGFKKAKKIITGVAIALVIIGLSRVLVSFLFSLYSTELSKNI